MTTAKPRKMAPEVKRGVALRDACTQIRGELQALATDTLGKIRLARLKRDLLQLAPAFSQPPRR